MYTNVLGTHDAYKGWRGAKRWFVPLSGDLGETSGGGVIFWRPTSSNENNELARQLMHEGGEGKARVAQSQTADTHLDFEPTFSALHLSSK